MFTLFCLLLIACGLSFTIGFLWNEKALAKEKKAVVNAELRMLDAQSRSGELETENKQLKVVLQVVKGVAEYQC